MNNFLYYYSEKLEVIRKSPQTPTKTHLPPLPQHLGHVCYLLLDA